MNVATTFLLVLSEFRTPQTLCEGTHVEWTCRTISQRTPETQGELIPTTAVPIQKTQVHEFFPFEQIVRCLTMYKERNIGAPCGYRNRNGNFVPFPDRDST